MVRQGRATINPLKSVPKREKKATFNRRALTREEFWSLIAVSGKRALPYLFAGCTGLRRSEMKKILWTDVRLDAAQPFIDVRAEITKAKRAAIMPLVLPLALALRERKALGVDASGRVFPRGLPSVKTLTKDLEACGIPVIDARGYRADFHALRHTFASFLATAGISELARVKLARHSEWRQTDRYTDPLSIPLFAEMAKFATGLPSSIASLNSGNSCQNESKPVHNPDLGGDGKTLVFRGETPPLGMAVPTWESSSLVPEGGLEPPRF
jgi:integrase